MTDNERAARRWWARERRVHAIGFWMAITVLGFSLALVRAVAMWIYDTAFVTHDPIWLLVLVGVTGALATLVVTARMEQP